MPVRKEGAEDSTRTSVRRGTPEKKDTTGRGWSAVANRRKEIDESKEFEDQIYKFFLTEDQPTAIIQFLDDEPFTIDAHRVRIKDKWNVLPCQLIKQRHCVMCREGIKTTTQVCFKILDYRGTWDKDKKRFKNDKPVEKLWMVGMQVAEQIKNFSDRKKKPLSQLVIELTRSGSGKSVAYNFSQAEDDDGERMLPKKVKEEYGDIEQVILGITPNDKYLESQGFDVDED